MARLPHSGVLEFDFDQGRFPLAIALPDETVDSTRSRAFVAAFCVEEVEFGQLLEWRSSFVPPFEACPCCQTLADHRRANPDAHPLTAILADLVDLRLALHCRIVGSGFDFSRFIEPRRLSFEDESITLNDDSGDCVLRIDPAHAHVLWILPIPVDGECRTSVRVYDTLGNMNLEFSVPGERFVAPWQHYCVAACS